MKNRVIDLLPLKIDLETPVILKKTIIANKELGILKGIIKTIPNQNILINAICLQEAKDSSEIEAIITTHDELYQSAISGYKTLSQTTKEVQNYREALDCGYNLLRKYGFISLNHICLIQQTLEKNNAGIRKQCGTVLRNINTGEIVYTPPQSYDEIVNLMNNLEQYINDSSDDVDPLIRMAIIHYQFESIHPFYDGNGRTGRIINVLFLILNQLLDVPVIYPSRYIILHKGEYYNRINAVRLNNDWEGFIIFMLDAIAESARLAIDTIERILVVRRNIKEKIKNKFAFYSADLVDALLLYPYTKIAHFSQQLGISRQTAASYLRQLENIGIVKSKQIWKTKFYINTELFNALVPASYEVPDTKTMIVTESPANIYSKSKN